MSNKMFQNVVSQFSEIIDRTIGITDENGMVIACDDMGRIGEKRPDIIDEADGSSNVFYHNGSTYLPVGSHMKIEHVVFVSGDDKEADKLVRIIAVSLTNIKNLYNEKYDKSSFVKNIILDNILPGDIYSKSKELMFTNEANRIVYLIKFNNKSDIIPYEIIQNMFPDKNKDFVISIGEKDIVLVKELNAAAGEEESGDPEYIAKSIVATINAEFFTKVMVGIGSVVNSVKDLSRSFKEAQVAIEVGKVFENEKCIVSYDNLGIGRLIYQLPTTLCEIFLEEVFKAGSLENLDRESLMTMHSFFENNLNVSETSRKLFVHRNTLVYRLEKIKKLTGLDLREFEHAIIFKVALMVNKYLSTKPVKY